MHPSVHLITERTWVVRACCAEAGGRIRWWRLPDVNGALHGAAAQDFGGLTLRSDDARLVEPVQHRRMALLALSARYLVQGTWSAPATR